MRKTFTENVGQSLTVSIGRNIGSVPMEQERWERFTARVLSAVRMATSEIYFIGTGQGIYQGQSEESFTVIGAAAHECSSAALAVSLHYMAEEFGQDAIAMTEGTTSLVFASRH